MIAVEEKYKQKDEWEHYLFYFYTRYLLSFFLESIFIKV